MVSPDMLGYGYEELLAERHGAGAFYTRPAEVRLMCRESLRACLELRCPEVSRELVAALVYGEPLDGMAPEQALALYSALHSVTVCDPAAGAGTFPVAMLRLLAGCLRTLGARLAGFPAFAARVRQGALSAPDDAYGLLRHLLTRCICGCDLDAGAVEVARLRLWLELIAVCAGPAPLPDLGGRLLAGDALVGALGRDSDGTLVSCESLWGHPTQRTEHRERRTRDVDSVAVLGAQLSALAGEGRHVLWPLAFPEVFGGEQPGFDIVIGNPPYLRQELIDRVFGDCGLLVRKRDLQQLYGRLLRLTISGQSDLYCYFFYRGLMLLRQRDGVLCYICSNSWLDVEFGAALRASIVRAARVRAIVERGRRLFAGADINTTINLLLTGPPAGEDGPAAFVVADGDLDSVMRAPLPRAPGVTRRDGARLVSVAGDELRESLAAGRWGARYLRAPDIYLALMERLEGRLLPLGELARVYRGVTTGSNDFFLFDAERARALGIPPALLQPVLASTRDLVSLMVEPARLGRLLLLCPFAPAELRARGMGAAADYIEASGSQATRARGRHTRGGVALAGARTLRPRPQWWTLPDVAGGDLLAPRLIRERFAILANPAHVRATDMFFNLALRPGYDAAVAAALGNTTLVYLLIEVLGRINVGGRINVYGPELAALRLPDPALFGCERRAELLASFARLAARAPLPAAQEAQAPDRAGLDRLVCETLGIADLREAIAEALVESVARRTARERQ